MYKFLVSDFLNPFALASGGVASGAAYVQLALLLPPPPLLICSLSASHSYVNPVAIPVILVADIEQAQLIAGSCGVLLTQLFFSWRVWVISRTTFRMPLRLIISALTVILALFSCGYYMDLAVKGFNNSSLTVNTPDFNLAYTLAASSRVLFDLFITFAMTITLYRSRSGVKQMDHVITLVIVFIVNTNLLTTLLSISELVTFFTFPRATIYGGLGFLTPKLYCNALLASLNSRQFIRNELNPAGATVLSASEPTMYAGRPKAIGDPSASHVSMKGMVRDTMKRSVSDGEAQDSYEMTEQAATKLPYLIPDI
ncbi:hypothetical protein AB1N83_012213 [Pleurotus pulmonarius]